MPIIFFIGVILEFLFLPFQFYGDGQVRQHFIVELMRNRTIEPMKYSLIGPIFSFPLMMLEWVSHSNFWLIRYNFFLLCFASFFLYRLLRTQKTKYFLFVFIAFLFLGSMFPGHIIHYYGEVFSATLMMLGIVLIQKNKTALGWILVILSVGNTPATFFPLLVLCAYKIVKDKNWLYIFLPLITAISLIIEAKIRNPIASAGFTHYLFEDRGAPTLLPYSGRPGFSYPFIFGLMAQLISFGKGLLFFAPGLLFIPIVLKKLTDRNLREIFILWLIYLSGLVLVYSKWWAWYGGWFWGPRFLLFASIPASFALAFVLTHTASKTMRLAVMLVTLWSFWVGTNGALLEQTGLDICAANNYAFEHLCWYVPEFSPLFHPLVDKSPLALISVCISFFLWFLFIRINYNKRR